jgi:hypothetical protein
MGRALFFKGTSLQENKTINKYKQIKWEKEAYSNQDKIRLKFKNSNELKELIKNTTEPNIKFILENGI